jgi:hypothetical protein
MKRVQKKIIASIKKNPQKKAPHQHAQALVGAVIGHQAAERW